MLKVNKHTFFLCPEQNTSPSPTYEQKIFHFSGDFQRTKFQESIDDVLSQDPSLQVEWIQVVYRDISTLEADQQDRVLSAYQQKVLDQMDNHGICQFAFFRLADQKYRLIWTHYSIEQFPKWKALLFLTSVLESYDHGSFHSNVRMDETQMITYWKTYLKDIQEPTKLPQWPNVHTSAPVKVHEKYTLLLEREVFRALRQCVKNKGLSLPVFMQAVWAFLLWRYHDQDEILLPVISSYGNFIPLRLKLHEKMTFLSLVHMIQQELEKHQRIPYIENLIDFDHLISISHPEGFSVEVNPATDKDFFVKVYWDAQLKVEIHYRLQRYPVEQVEQIGRHLINVLQQIVQHPDGLLTEIEILSVDEQNHLMNSLNDTRLEIPKDWTTVDQLFSRQAEKRPNQIAVFSEVGSLTYQELEKKSNQLATFLQKSGIKKGHIVALMTQNSPWMLVGILGIIKAGAAYLPIDQNYPQKRIEYILEDSQVRILLTESGMDLSVPSSVKVWPIDCLEDHMPSSWEHTHHSTDPVYVIYTSGSTGRPKGVVVEHRALINLIAWHCRYYQLTEKDRSTKYAGYGFDASVWEIFPYLSVGATIYIVPEAMKYDMDRLHAYVEEHQITCSFLPTPVAEQFMKRDNRSLRVLLTGGDRLRSVQSQSYQVVNNYGPTENTVVTTAGFINPQDSVISIGKPIANNQIYILNRFDQLQPIGVPGELCVSGSSLARGYLGKPELTQQRFVKHPLIKGERIYRTGDLVRWLPDGRIEYLGRMDQQIQIRGFRVELGEIERCLLQHRSVQDAVVIARNPSQQEPSLCAYVVTELEDLIPTLRSYLKNYLPDYMIPVYWKKLKKIPLTANGKLDEQALPEPQLVYSEKKFSRPTTETEKKLLSLWQEVLNQNRISVEDHFFHIGGHSLKASMLISRIYDEWGVRISLADFFDFPILKDMARLIDQSESQITQTIHPIHPVQPKTFYPASSVQKRLYAIEQTQQVGTAYHIPIVWRFEGNLQMDQLRWTIQTLIQRHEALRTSFTFVDGDLVQKINDQIHWKLEEMTVNHEEEVRSCIDSLIRPFDFEKGPLFRVGIITLPNDIFYLMWDIHHIISDGISIGILHREFSLVYQGKVLSELPLQYKDFSVWQQQQLSNHELERDRKYWLKQFSELPPTAELTTDFQRSMSQPFIGEKCCFPLDDELIDACKRLSHDQDVTLYMLFLAVYTILFAKYTEQESVVVGSVIAGRSRKEWESVFGMFVNTLPIRATYQRNLPFTKFLAEIKQQVLDAQDHGDYPFAELLEQLNLQWDPRRNPLFDTVFVMQNMEVPPVQIPGLKVETVPYHGQSSMFDMTWEIVEENNFELWVEYNTTLWRQDTIERMVRHFTHILKQVIQSPQTPLAEIHLITEKEQTKILSEFNRTQYALPKGQTVLDLIHQQVQAQPEKIAIVEKDEKVTYQRLHEESNQLAHFLRHQGVSKGTIVSILSENSIELLISILGVMKAGAAYLPIDPSHPVERIRFMFQDSRSSMLLAPRGPVTSEIDMKTWVDLSEKPWLAESTQDVKLIHSDRDLAYVIYTSGSTGKPKGVMVSHRALLNLVHWHNQYYALSDQDRCTKFAGVSFDASVWEIFPCFAVGATLYIVDADVRQDIYLLNQFFERHGITISFLPTAMAESFMQLKNHSLRTLLVGGDQLHQVKKQSYQVVNNYGPTENTVVTTSYVVDDPNIQSIPIGKPIFNNQVYIVNEDLQLQPIGVPGELCISGDSLAEGYLHQPELTADRFVSNPFQKGKKMYRTGDKARWLPDGNVEYLGRMDDQVQIRGFRIELGEIETLLLQHEQVKDVVVFAHSEDQNQKVLCAYLIVHEKGQIHALQDYLRKSLPEYMIPTFWFELDTFPMTPNGKIDRKALPRPKKERSLPKRFVKPTSSTQQILVDIWKEVLHVPEVSVDENFFSLGGDSIKAIQVAARLRQHHRKIAVNEIMQYPTIVELAPHVVEAQQNFVEDELKTGVIPLTPIQQWFFQQKLSNPSHWNQALMIPRQDRWDPQAICRTFQKLIEIHDILRVNFMESNGEIQQIIQEVDEDYFTLDVFSYIYEDDDNEVEKKIRYQANRLQRSLNLQQGPLIRLAVFETHRCHYLLIIIHHLLVDGVSWRILLEDFWKIYQCVCQNQEISFLPQTHSFSLWANQLTNYAQSEELLKEIPYWQQMEQLEVPSLRKDRKENIDRYLKDSATIEFTLSKHQTHQLLHEVHKAYRTEVNDVLLTALGCAVKEWSQVNRMAIHLEGHGRESIIEGIDITRTMGWFTSMYPVVLELSVNELSQMLKSVKEQLRKIPKKGIGYGILRYLTAPENRSQLEFRLQPEISFNYLGQFDQKIHFAGIGSNSDQIGECLSPYTKIHPIEIYGIVVNDQMQFRFLYHHLTYHRETIQNLVELYQTYLARLIEHCAHQTEVSWTPSDFSASDVSVEELDQFLESLD